MAQLRLMARNEQMKALENALIHQGESKVVLYGLAGSGKTSLARRFAEHHREYFTGGVVFVADRFSSKETWEAVLRIDRELPALVVLDAIDAQPLHVTGELERRLLRRYPKAQMLMTSRIELLGVGAIGVEMPPRNVEQVVRVLASRYRGDRSRLDALAEMLAGNRVATEVIAARLTDGFAPERILEWIESGALPVSRGPSGEPLGARAPERRAFDVALTEVSEELIQKLGEHPELLYTLDPRKFEQLVAELYRRRGYEATLTPASGDQGVDVYVVSRDGVGETLWVVQAKRWAAHRKVGAGVVRELYGTVNMTNASAGILLTTSFFEPGAQAMERELRFRLKLADYMDLQEMLREPASRKSQLRTR